MTERLIRIEKILMPGTYEVTTRLYVAADGDGLIGGAVQTDRWWTEHAYDIKRVEVDPELPTLPGALILCEIKGFGEQYATLKLGGNLTGHALWLIPGHDDHIPVDQITRVIEVIRPGVEPERPKPGPRPGPAVGR